MAEKHSRARSAMGGKHKKPHSIHVKRAHSGGFIATHHHKPDDQGTMAEPEEHVIPDMESLQAHMASNMGDQTAAPMQPPAAAPAPQAGM